MSAPTAPAPRLFPVPAPAAYVATVLRLYTDLPHTPAIASDSDRQTARRLHDDGITLSVVENALVLGSMRRLCHRADLPPLSPIRSLAYFRAVIDELLADPRSESYLEHVRLKHRKACAALAAGRGV